MKLLLASFSCASFYILKGALPPETEARNRKLTVFAMSLYFFFCVLWAYFVVTDGMSTNRGLQQAEFEEWRPVWDGDTALHTGYYSVLFRSGRRN